MKKRTRAWRRWGERAARWTLTLLLIALVGVTAASGWWRLEWYAIFKRVDPAADSIGTMVQVRRGSLSWFTAPMGRHWSAYSRVTIEWDAGWPDRASPSLTGSFEGPGPPPPFNFSHTHVGSRIGVVPLIYLALAVALPTFFLWYRRIHRRYRRGLCARCGYDLAGLAVVEERIVCPECGASNPAARILKRGLPGDPSPGARSDSSD